MVDGRKDGRWTPEQGYTISSPSEPDGSGELINSSRYTRVEMKFIMKKDVKGHMTVWGNICPFFERPELWF